MKRTRNLTLSVILCLVGILLSGLIVTGCSSAKPLEGSQKDAVLAYSEPIADKLLQGMNECDYQAFSRDFDQQMLQALPESNFKDELLPTVADKYSKYVSGQVASGNATGINMVLIYTAKFEKNDNVTITLKLQQAEPHKVAGLYFK